MMKATDKHAEKIPVWVPERPNEPMSASIPGIAIRLVKEGKYKGMIEVLVRNKLKYYLTNVVRPRRGR